MPEDKIAESLGLTPIEGEFERTDNLPSKPESVKPNFEQKQIETDADYVRGNLYDLIDKGTRSMDELLAIADQSQHPRAYEVISTMMKTLVDTNKELLDMHGKKKKLIEEQPKDKTPETVNNNLFVGSTKDVLEMIKKKYDEPNESD